MGKPKPIHRDLGRRPEITRYSYQVADGDTRLGWKSYDVSYHLACLCEQGYCLTSTARSQSRDPDSMLKIELYHSSARPGGTRAIGSTKIRIQDLVDLAKLSNGRYWCCIIALVPNWYRNLIDVSLELFNNGVRRATLIIQFQKIASPVAPAVSQGSRVNYAASESSHMSPGTAKARLSQAASKGMSQVMLN